MKNLLLALFMVFAAIPAFAEDTATQETESWLKPAESEYICMVNDSLFKKPQIPVEVGDKTYYGCCMGCVGRLKQDTAIRKAIDPVSGNEVDKAEAIIGVAPDETVYYFENAENMKAFTKKHVEPSP